ASGAVNWHNVVANSARRGDAYLATPIMAAYVLVQTQSAECERQFAKVTRMKDLLGEQTSAQVVEQYLLVQGTSALLLMQDVFFEGCLREFFETEQRQGTITSGMRRHGSQLIRRQRAVRKDKGEKRPVYTKRKRFAQLKNQPTARKLVRNEEACVRQVDKNDPVSHADIRKLLSPKKKKIASENQKSEVT
ncbi:unnamed protein product, partial [Symbiodinium microadriaticum]